MRNALLGAGFVVVFLVGLLLGPLLGSGGTAARDAGAPAPEGGSVPKPSREGAPGSATVEQPSSPGASAANGMSLVPAKHAYGKVLEGEVRAHVVKVRRPLEKPLKLGRLYSPCPCVFVRSDGLSIPEGQEAEVRVSIHSLTLEGKKSFPFYVEVVEPVRKALRGDVSIEVERVPAKILVKPDSLHLGVVRGEKTVAVKLYNLTARPMTLEPPECSIEGVEVGVRGGPRIEAGKQATICLTTPKPGLPAGPIKGTVTLRTNCHEHSVIAIPVDGTARKPR